MKLLLCTIYLPADDDGVSNSSRQLVSHLVKKGIDTTVCTTDWCWPEKEIVNQQSEKLKIFKTLKVNNIEFSPRQYSYIKKKINEFDIIQLQGTFNLSTYFGAHISNSRGTPYIISPRGNSIPTSIKDKHIHHAIRKRVFLFLFGRKILLNADCIICTSKKEQEETRQFINRDNITYIPNGLNYTPYLKVVDRYIIDENLGITSNRPIFLFLGRLAREKAIPFLMSAWNIFTQKIPDAVLVLAGSHDWGYSKEIIKSVQSFNCQDSVIIPGHVKEDLKCRLQD